MPFIIILIVIAALLREDFVFTLLYLFAGAYALGRWWSSRALAAVQIARALPARAFLEEEIPVKIEVNNSRFLPLAWLRLHDSLPLELATPSFFRSVVSMGPYERISLGYTLKTRKRGYYCIGPLFLYSGDILGLADQGKRELPADFLTVFPKIVPLSHIELPTHSPMGALRHTRPIYEDPSRTRGKRDYISGDSLRRIDWKTSAAVGRLQVKQFEPSVALEVAILLNLNASEYDQRTRFSATELAIVIAASLASWVSSQKQAVGLITNGADPLMEEGHAQHLPPRKGRGHLMRLLEVLARVQMSASESLVALMRRASPQLSWGATLALITGQPDDDLFDSLFHTRRAGLDAMLVMCGPVRGLREIQRRAAHFHIPLYHLLDERDLDIWR